MKELHQTVWIKILIIFAKKNEGLRISDICHYYKSDNYSNLHVNVNLLVENGHLTKDEDTKKYYLTDNGKSFSNSLNKNL